MSFAEQLEEEPTDAKDNVIDWGLETLIVCLAIGVVLIIAIVILNVLGHNPCKRKVK